MPHIDIAIDAYINDAADRLCELANAHNKTYTGEFNGIDITAEPGSKPRHIVDAYWTEKERLTSDYFSSPERKRARQEAEDRQNATISSVRR